MSTKKEIWRLLEAGEVWQKGDQTLNNLRRWVTPSRKIYGKEVLDVGAMGRRRMTLPDPQGWISVKERMPTKEDAGSSGCVIWARKDGGIYREYWDTRMGPFPDYWMPIPSFPDTVDPDEEAWEEFISGVGASSIKQAFMAGRKSVVTEGGSHA